MHNRDVLASRYSYVRHMLLKIEKHRPSLTSGGLWRQEKFLRCDLKKNSLTPRKAKAEFGPRWDLLGEHIRQEMDAFEKERLEHWMHGKAFKRGKCDRDGHPEKGLLDGEER